MHAVVLYTSIRIVLVLGRLFVDTMRLGARDINYLKRLMKTRGAPCLRELNAVISATKKDPQRKGVAREEFKALREGYAQAIAKRKLPKSTAMFHIKNMAKTIR